MEPRIHETSWIRAFSIIMLALCATPTSFAQLNRFTGNWINGNLNTSGVTKVAVVATANSIEVHAWGKCHPTDCDWGAVQGYAYAGKVVDDLAAQARSISATYRTSFSETIMVMHAVASDQLQIEIMTRFLDSSGRTSYSAVYAFVRTAIPMAEIQIRDARRRQ